MLFFRCLMHGPDESRASLHRQLSIKMSISITFSKCKQRLHHVRISASAFSLHGSHRRQRQLPFTIPPSYDAPLMETITHPSERPRLSLPSVDQWFQGPGSQPASAVTLSLSSA